MDEDSKISDLIVESNKKTDASSSDSNSTIKVFIRARPSSLQNVSTNSCIILEEDEAIVSVNHGNPSGTVNKFKFSGVLGPSVDQKLVYSSLRISSLIQDDLLSGLNCCVIAYGK